MNDLTTLAESAKVFIQAAQAVNSRRAYKGDCSAWAAWTAARGLSAFPAQPEGLVGYLAELARSDLRPATLERRLAAIAFAHRALGLPSPVNEFVRSAMSGIRRTLGTAPRPKAPLMATELRAIIARIEGDSLLALRDRALLLCGWAGALRRSELASLCVEDISDASEGILVRIPYSKTDQSGEGQVVAIPFGEPATCPVWALRAWLATSKIESGPVFRRLKRGTTITYEGKLSDYAVSLILKRRALAAGLNPDSFAAHSLRSGFLSSAAAAGADMWKMMDQSRHKSVQTVRRYVRSAEIFKDHAGKGLL